MRESEAFSVASPHLDATLYEPLLVSAFVEDFNQRGHLIEWNQELGTVTVFAEDSSAAIKFASETMNRLLAYVIENRAIR